MKILYKYYYEQKKRIKSDMLFHFNKTIILKEIDNLWQDHLSSMENLRQTIHLRGYAQQDPKQEYKKEGFNLFKKLLQNIKKSIVISLIKTNVQNQKDNTYNNINYTTIKYESFENKNLIIDYIK